MRGISGILLVVGVVCSIVWQGGGSVPRPIDEKLIADVQSDAAGLVAAASLATDAEQLTPKPELLTRLKVFTGSPEHCKGCEVQEKHLAAVKARGLLSVGSMPSDDIQVVRTDDPNVGAPMAARYKIEYVPTIIATDKDGKEKERRVGAQTAEALEAMLAARRKAAAEPQPKSEIFPPKQKEGSPAAVTIPRQTITPQPVYTFRRSWR